MITIYHQQVWFEGDEHYIRFSETSINDPEEMPGLELLEVDYFGSDKTPSRLWKFCESQMDTAVAITEEEAYRW